MLYMYNEQDEQNFKVGFKIHLLPKPCPFYHPFSLRKIVSFDFVSMVNCKFFMRMRDIISFSMAFNEKFIF